MTHETCSPRGRAAISGRFALVGLLCAGCSGGCLVGEAPSQRSDARRVPWSFSDSGAHDAIAELAPLADGPDDLARQRDASSYDVEGSDGQLVPSADFGPYDADLGPPNKSDDASQIDSGCIVGAQRSCYKGPAQTVNVGVCRAGKQKCVAGGWGPCANQVVPSKESCDGKDNDCDGATDEGTTIKVWRDLDGDGFGAGVALKRCSAGPGYVTNSADCYDKNKDARPNLPAGVFYASHRGDGSFDFDCDGTHRQHNQSVSFACPTAPNACSGSGWSGPNVPPCGTKAWMIYCAQLGTVCQPSPGEVVSRCR